MVKKYERSKKKYIKSITVKSENDIGILFRKDEQVFYKRYLKYIRNHSKLKILGEATVFFLDRYINEYKKNKIKYVQRLYTKLFKDKNILFVSPESPLMTPSFQFLVEKKIIKSFSVFNLNRIISRITNVTFLINHDHKYRRIKITSSYYFCLPCILEYYF